MMSFLLFKYDVVFLFSLCHDNENVDFFFNFFFVS